MCITLLFRADGRGTRAVVPYNFALHLIYKLSYKKCSELMLKLDIYVKFK
ncbi:hypothetical protein SAMN04488577_3234 [Bacillus sp. cl95]|nr:hypothetical protein SAMN02799634_104280 [Bacillus sp. UNCCL13]SFQ88535.1 hypothetical protein SAMN04488577_3234 [Bacillus sp. cl95]